MMKLRVAHVNEEIILQNDLCKLHLVHGFRPI